jgi:hypothetical protein
MCKADMSKISKREKLKGIASFVSLGISFAFVLLVLFWLLYPYKTLEVNNSPYPVTQEVRKGSSVMFEMDYCKYTNKPVTIARRYVDGIIYVVPNLVSAYNEKGCRVSLITEDVPENLPEGEYTMVFFYTYQVNPIREITVSASTQTFKIVD